MAAFIVSDHESTGSRIRDVLTFGGQECPSSHILPLESASGRLGRETQVDLVIVALPTDRERGLEMIPGFSRMAAGKVLAVGPTTDAKLVLRALRAGAADFVDVEDLETELDAAIRRMEAEANAPAQPGRLIAVLAPNGGAGSSTIAVNLSAALARDHRDVGLLDMKLESGDLAAMLDLRPTFTLGDLCHNASRLDRVMFERSLVKHHTGVHLLAPPHRLSDARDVRPDGVGLAISLGRASFPFVVADLDHTYREEQWVAIRQADEILVAFRLDFSSLRNTRRALEHLEEEGIDRAKIRLVVNRYGQPQEVPASKAEEALGRKIGHYIPEDPKAVNRANNHGVPVVVEAPSAKVSRALTRLAAELGKAAKT